MYQNRNLNFKKTCLRLRALCLLCALCFAAGACSVSAPGLTATPQSSPTGATQATPAPSTTVDPTRALLLQAFANMEALASYSYSGTEKTDYKTCASSCQISDDAQLTLSVINTPQNPLKYLKVVSTSSILQYSTTEYFLSKSDYYALVTIPELPEMGGLTKTPLSDGADILSGTGFSNIFNNMQTGLLTVVPPYQAFFSDSAYCSITVSPEEKGTRLVAELTKEGILQVHGTEAEPDTQCIYTYLLDENNRIIEQTAEFDHTDTAAGTSAYIKVTMEMQDLTLPVEIILPQEEE